MMEKTRKEMIEEILKDTETLEKEQVLRLKLYIDLQRSREDWKKRVVEENPQLEE